MENTYDIIIVGGGPAGMTAALYAKRAGKNPLIIERMFLGGQVAITPEVKNYPGSSSQDGAMIAFSMQKQLEEIGCEHILASVTAFEKEGSAHKVITTKGEFSAPAIILAMGAPPRKLGIEGEEKFAGAGVSYCATCDGNFFKNKTVCVIGGGNTAMDDAVYLSALCEKVYVIHRREEFRALDSYIEQAKQKENTEFVVPFAPVKINGDKKVSSLEIKNTKTGEIQEIMTDGIFVAVGASGNTAVLPKDIATDKNGYIIADETCKTNAEGVFAAGDIRKKPLRQIVTATADGANAATQALLYLQKIK